MKFSSATLAFAVTASMADAFTVISPAFVPSGHMNKMTLHGSRTSLEGLSNLSSTIVMAEAEGSMSMSEPETVEEIAAKAVSEIDIEGNKESDNSELETEPTPVSNVVDEAELEADEVPGEDEVESVQSVEEKDEIETDAEDAEEIEATGEEVTTEEEADPVAEEAEELESVADEEVVDEQESEPVAEDAEEIVSAADEEAPAENESELVAESVSEDEPADEVLEAVAEDKTDEVAESEQEEALIVEEPAPVANTEVTSLALKVEPATSMEYLVACKDSELVSITAKSTLDTLKGTITTVMYSLKLLVNAVSREEVRLSGTAAAQKTSKALKSLPMAVQREDSAASKEALNEMASLAGESLKDAGKAGAGIIASIKEDEDLETVSFSVRNTLQRLLTTTRSALVLTGRKFKEIKDRTE